MCECVSPNRGEGGSMGGGGCRSGWFRVCYSFIMLLLLFMDVGINGLVFEWMTVYMYEWLMGYNRGRPDQTGLAIPANGHNTIRPVRFGEYTTPDDDYTMHTGCIIHIMYILTFSFLLLNNTCFLHCRTLIIINEYINCHPRKLIGRCDRWRRTFQISFVGYTKLGKRMERCEVNSWSTIADHWSLALAHSHTWCAM